MHYRKIIITAIAILALSASSSFATIINIPDDYPTIQEGIDSSTNGDTVLVQPGTYVENININIRALTLASLYLITNDTSYISSTIIDGDSAFQVINLWYVEDTTSAITGFTIQNGYHRDTGAGIYCMGCNLKINHNIIRDNTVGYPQDNSFGSGIACYYSNVHVFFNKIVDNKTIAFSEGGGVYCYRADALIENNFISGNDALFGGGIYIDSCNAMIVNNKLVNNTSHHGGGIAASHSQSSISGNLIMNNYSDGHGGGIFLNRSDLQLAGNIIANNEGYIEGGGLVIHIGSPLIANNIIYNNRSFIRGGGILTYDNTDAIFVNNIIRANTANNDPQICYAQLPQVMYCNVQGGWPGEGNIDIDPLFRDPESGDFHLMAIECGDSLDSPCIDMGDPDILDSLLDCDWGLSGLRSDMGAYGGGGGSVDIGEPMPELPQVISLSQNYPNPFNASTLIKYELPLQSRVKIEIYDILGRLVGTLQDGLQPAGYYQVIWNAQDFSSGLYFYMLQAGDYTQTKKMILIK